MKPPESSFFKRLGFALRGVRLFVRQERHAPIHLAAALGAGLLAAFLEVSMAEWAVLLIAASFVLITETINTAIERVVDLASPEWHALARDAKDLAAGATLLASVCALLLGLMILLPPLLFRFI